LTRTGVAYWALIFRAWATVALLIVVLYAAWHLPEWRANYASGQLLTEIAMLVAVALTAAALVALLFTAAWLVAGGIRASESRPARLFDLLATNAPVFAFAGVVVVAAVQWFAASGIEVPGIVKAVLAVLVLAVPIWTAFSEARRGSADTTIRRLSALSRRSALALWLASAVAAIAGGVRLRSLAYIRRPPAPSGAPRPNFLFVTFDALSANDMSLYGYHLPTTPHIDRLAGQGIVFDSYYSASAFTTSAVTSLFTGQNVPRHGWYQALTGRLPDAKKKQNLAYVLKRHGYATAAFVANVAAHPMHIGLEDGFDILPAPTLPTVPGTDFAYHLTHSGIGRTVEEAVGGRLQAWGTELHLTKLPEPFYGPEPAFEGARMALAKLPEPFFVWVHLAPPHFPYEPPPPFLGRFLAGGEYRNAADYGNSPLREAALNLGAYPPELQLEIDKVRLRYDEYLAYADACFGDFLGRLDAGLMNRTAVVVSADHGENFNHGFWGHGETKMWDGSMHIPLVVRLPGEHEAGTRVPGVAGEIDFLPTILDLAGIACPSWAEGRSLRAMWDGREKDGRTRAAIGVYGGLQEPISNGVVAVVSGREKYILDIASRRGLLFDIESDPGEMQDLQTVRPQRASQLRREALALIAGRRENEQA
jgi:arylsulfatase A-like enzyme